MIHEGTFTSERKDQADLYGHSTIEDVAMLAKQARVGTLILTHISSRYADMAEQLEQTAKEIFPASMIASDYFIYRLRE